MENNKRIVIIGAGPSGIAAATKLFENGFTNVTILEAEKSIGGRVCTAKLGEYFVDLGGQWVHGEKDNIVFNLANAHNLLERSDTSRRMFEFTDSLGKTVSTEIGEKIQELFNFKYIDNECQKPYESMGDCLENMFDMVFKDTPEVLKDRRKYLDAIELALQAGDSSNTWYNISTTNYWEQLEGDQMINWKKGTYFKILDILMKRYPGSEKELPVLKNTVLGCEVKSVDYSSKDGESPVTITSTDGRSFKADHVIVTVSLGVLKAKHRTMFHPPLPTDKVSAIEGFGYGNVAKIYLLFEKPFWKVDDGKVIQNMFLWNEADKKLIEADPEKSWLLGLATVFNVEHKPNLLEIWISKYGRAMEVQPEEKVLNHCIETLKRFLGKKYNVTKPVGMVRTQWSTNPHFMGTFSYRSVETQRKKLSSDKLEEPVQDLKILFAGEATSKHRYATVDGAIVSGWKAADRLLKYYGNPLVTDKS